MPRNRFDAIMQYLHLAGNAKPDPNDKMWKVRPLYNLINQRCLMLAPFASDLSVDESMIPYYGRNNSKQRIANKPVRMGYKMWVLAETLGYVIQFDPYQGAKFGKAQKKSETCWGVGERVVLNLIETLPKSLSYNLFFDNIFTSFRLVKFLGDYNIRATGTVRQQYLQKVPIIGPKELQKKPRGFYKEISAADNSITLVGWNDTKPVYICSNAHLAQPAKSVQRWDRKSLSFVQVPRPNTIDIYNKGMGGVD